MPAPIALRRSWRAARATFAIAAVTGLAWLLTSGAGLANLFGDDLVVPVWLMPLVALLLHGDFLHLMLNMLALIAFGRAVEPAVGTLGLVILYLAGAVTAAAVNFFVHPEPFSWIGAGGGVGAVLGAYALLFGRNQPGRGRDRLKTWRYALWLCVGWTGVSLLVSYAFAGNLAVYYAAALIASFAIGLLLARPLLLLHYRKA